MGKLSTGAAVMAAGPATAAAQVALLQLADLAGIPTTPTQAAAWVTLGVFGVGAWLHQKKPATADAGTQAARE